MNYKVITDSFKNRKIIRERIMFTAFAVGLGLTTNVMAQVPSYVPSNGLVGWWPFNGNANDESGNGNNGVVNGATLTTDRFGNVEKAYSFDGNGDFINCGNNPIVNITGSVSVSGWIYANNLIGDHGIISKMNTGIATYELITAGNLMRWMNVGGFLFSNSINPNQWLHVVSVFDSTLLLKSIYINGVLNSTSSSSVSTIPTNSDNLYIGAHQPSIVPGWSWDGKLDNIGIWNRALTDQEISNLYNGTNVGISDNYFSDKIQIYPNPSNDHITIDAGNLATMNGYSIKIEDAQGQQVFQNAVNQQQFYVDITTWGGNGLYFVRIIDPQGNTVDIKKIVLQ